jgi:hypothetical protein
MPLDKDKKQILDSGIKKMISAGASQDDVMAYAKDFNEKFGAVKKKEATESGSEDTSLDTPQVGTQKPSVSSALSEDGLYKYEDRPGVVYKKENDDWYVDVNNTGDFKLIEANDRKSVLNKSAKRIDNEYIRPNNTIKGYGYLGELKMKDGSGKTATEMTIGISLDGKDTDIPLIVPTLSKEEIDWILKGNDPLERNEMSDRIVNKAVDFAKKRINEGKTIYATKSEEGPALSEGGLYKDSKNKPYKYDEETNSWRGYSYTDPSDKGNVDVYKEIVTDPSKVNYLNKKYGKSSSTSELEQIFTGYPGKESNEYRVVGNTWERRVKGQKDWQTISNQGSIDALNSVFKQDIKYGSTAKYKNAVVDEYDINRKSSLDKINKDLINSSEDDVKKWIDKNFPGFAVKTQGFGTDNISITAPSGATMSIPLNDWDDEDNNAQAIKLREFMKVNSDRTMFDKSNELIDAKQAKDQLAQTQISEARMEGKTPNVFEKIDADKKLVSAEDNFVKATSDMYKTLYTQKDYEGGKEAIASLPKDKKTVDIAKRKNEELTLQYKDFKKEIDSFDEFKNEIQSKINNGEITVDEGNSRINELSEVLKAKQNDLQSNLNNLNVLKQSIEQSIASNTLINEAQGDFAGGIYKKFVSGATSLFRPLADMSKEEQASLVQDLVGNATTTEYTDSEKRSDIAKAMFSLSESMGVSLPLAPLGSIATGVGFFSQSFYEMSDDLSGVEGISDNEKLIMSTGYGIVSAVLENIGLGAVTGKLGKDVTKGISMAILKKTFKELPKDASREVLESIISKNAKLMLVEAGITTGVAALTEGTTEFLQKLSQEGIKESYDIIKDTDKFHNTQGFWDVIKEATYEGYLGAIGGGVMRGASNSANILVNKITTSVTNQQLDNEFRSLVNTVTDNDNYNTVIEQVKLDIKSGKITEDEGRGQLNDLALARDIVNQIPSDMPVRKARQAAELIKEKSDITQAIEGKDKALVASQTERINAINEELSKLGQDDIQEQTTDEGVLQPEQSEVGLQEMEQGNKEQEVVAEDEGETEIKIEKRRQEELNKYNSEKNKFNKDDGKGDYVITAEGNLYIDEINAKYDAELAALRQQEEVVVTPEQGVEVYNPEQMSEESLISDYNKYEYDKTDEGREKFVKAERELEKREQRKVFDASLDELPNVVKELRAKYKEEGIFTELKDLSQISEIVDRYSNAEQLSDAEVIKDFKDAVFGNPTTWYSDGIKLRESVKEAGNRGISFKQLVEKLGGEFKADGFTEEQAKSTVEGMLDPIFNTKPKEQSFTSQERQLREEPTIDQVKQYKGQKALDWISAINSKLDEIIDPKNLNDATRVIPAIALKTILKALEVSIKAGMTVSKAVDKYFNENTEYTKEQFEATISRVPTVKSIISQSAKSQKRAFKQGKIEGKTETEAKLKPVIEKLRDLKKDRDAARAYILDQIKEFEGKKVLNARAVLNRLMRVNLNNPVAVDNFIEYAEKAFADQAYVEKINAIAKMNKSSNERAKVKLLQ